MLSKQFYGLWMTVGRRIGEYGEFSMGIPKGHSSRRKAFARSVVFE
jgi:hypothetical protein